MNRRGLVMIAILAAAAGLVWFYRAQIGLGRSQMTELIYLLLWLALIAGGAYAGRAFLGRHWLRNAALWLVIFCGAMGVYAYRDKLGAMLHPSAPRAAGAGVAVRRGGDGHFWTDAAINGAPVRMMIDTGASDIALTPRDARRAGLDPDKLSYIIPIVTAQGETKAAPVTLDTLEVGSIRLNHVPADVMREDGDISLLGMSFLNRLDGFRVRHDMLELEP